MSFECAALQGGPALILFDLSSSITLVGEADRKMLKAAVKSSPADQVRHRVVPQEAVVDMAESLAALKEEIVEVLREEKEEKAVSPTPLGLSRSVNRNLTAASPSAAAHRRHGDPQGREPD